MGDGVFTKARRPYALLLTWQPAWMEDAAEGSTASLVHTLTAAGYTRLALAFPVAPVDGKGYACKREEDLAAHLFGYVCEGGRKMWLVRVGERVLYTYITSGVYACTYTYILLHILLYT